MIAAVDLNPYSDISNKTKYEKKLLTPSTSQRISGKNSGSKYKLPSKQFSKIGLFVGSANYELEITTHNINGVRS